MIENGAGRDLRHLGPRAANVDRGAVHGSVTFLKQAMPHDPLIGTACNPEEVWQVTDEMLLELAP